MMRTRFFDGYTWYYSRAYGNWLLISPKTGFTRHYSESEVIRFIKQESGYDASTATTFTNTFAVPSKVS